MEALLIEITVKNSKSFLVGCFYRPPETSDYFPRNYNSLLQNHLTDMTKENKEVIMQNGFKQLIKKPTRITQTSSTLIDLIITNRPSTISKSDVIATSLSDHDMVACVRKLNFQKFESRTIKCRNYANYNPTNLNDEISTIDWQPVYQETCVSVALEYFNRTLKSVFDHHAPVIEKRVRGKNALGYLQILKNQ